MGRTDPVHYQCGLIRTGLTWAGRPAYPPLVTGDNLWSRDFLISSFLVEGLWVRALEDWKCICWSFVFGWLPLVPLPPSSFSIILLLLLIKKIMILNILYFKHFSNIFIFLFIFLLYYKFYHSYIFFFFFFFSFFRY